MNIDLKTLDELERMSNGATGKQWHIGHVSEFCERASIDNEDGTTVAISEFRRDQFFICTSRNALPGLIHSVRRMSGALKEIAEIQYADFGAEYALDCLKELGLE